jgi:transcriptional regulator with XRE-family HTH domain
MPVTLSPAALRAIRESAGLSRPAAGAAIGKTFGAIEQFEKGASRPSAETLGLLADTYGCSVGDFYDEDPGDPRQRYIAAVCRLLPPMTDQEIDGFAAVVRARRAVPA